MACAQTCNGETETPAPSACRSACARADRPVHSVLRPSAASVGLIDAQASLLASLGSPSRPRL